MQRDAMIKRILKAIRETIKGKPLKVRSSKWDAVRDAHVRKFPWCAACGSRSNLQVHHIMPFHLDSSKELDPSNLITLCEKSPTNCHLNVGHLGNWKKYNSSVREDAMRLIQGKTKTLGES